MKEQGRSLRTFNSAMSRGSRASIQIFGFPSSDRDPNASNRLTQAFKSETADPEQTVQVSSICLRLTNFASINLMLGAIPELQHTLSDSKFKDTACPLVRVGLSTGARCSLAVFSSHPPGGALSAVGISGSTCRTEEFRIGWHVLPSQRCFCHDRRGPENACKAFARVVLLRNLTP